VHSCWCNPPWYFTTVFTLKYCIENSSNGNDLNMMLMVTSCAIGCTRQYGYNLAIMNAPTILIQKFVNKMFRDTMCIIVITSLIFRIYLTLLVSTLFYSPVLYSTLNPLCCSHRKKTLLLYNIFLMLSSLLALTSRAAKSFEMIIISRVLVGINAGISMNVQPMYFGESASKHLQGAASLSSAIFTSLGVVLGQVVTFGGYEISLHNAIPGLIQLLTLPLFPESSQYLLIDQGKRRPIDALRCLRGCEIQRSELDEILQEQAEVKGLRASRPWELLADRNVRWQVNSISSTMQLCGNDSILGLSLDMIQYITICTGTCEFTNLLIERQSRKIILMGGYIFMTGQFCFLVFVAYCMFSSAFMLCFIPETKGKSMVDLMEDFNKLKYKIKSNQFKLYWLGEYYGVEG
uniref:Solute carrier family 2 member 11a n=1 Tax=Salmo trutta TaxID=8032 RepID=A0A674DLL8_SALTR